MTLTTDRPTSTPVSRSRAVTFSRVTTSQWLTFRTLRSSWAVLGAAVLGMVAIALLVAYQTRTVGPTLQQEDLVPSATLQGYYLGQLLIGALGVLFVTGEYGTGMIRSTLAAVPTRVPVLLAKMVVFTVVTAVAMTLASLLAFVSAQALLAHYRTGYSLADPGVLRVVLGTGLYLTLVGLLGGAIGWLVRSTPGALVSYFAVMLVIPVLIGGVLGSFGQTLAQWLPNNAGASFIESLRQTPSLSPGVGLAVLVGWVVAASGLAALQLRRRDA